MFFTTRNPVSLFHSDSDSAKISPISDATLSSVLRDSVPSVSSSKASFNTSAFIRGGMRQTLLASIGVKSAKPKPVDYQTRCIILPDGGNIKVDLAPNGAFEDVKDARPVVVLVHGILGDSQAPYIVGPANELMANGFRCASVNLRGCGGSRLTSPAYHDAGKMADLKSVLLFVQSIAPLAHQFLLGFSLGAGLVTNCLGELGDESPVTAAVGVSNVFSYGRCFQELKTKGTMMNIVINRILGARYRRLAKGLEKEAFTEACWMDKLSSAQDDASSLTPTMSTDSLSLSTYAASMQAPFQFYSPSIAPTIPISERTNTITSNSPPSSIHSTVDSRVHSFLETLNSRSCTMTSFSRDFIAPLSGASNVQEFCESTSSAQRIEKIRVPTLFLNAKDDPMLPGKYLPFEEVLGNPYVAMAVTERGGHLGWITKEKGEDGRPTQWFNKPIVEFFLGILQAKPANRPRMTTKKGPFPEMVYAQNSDNVGFVGSSDSFLRILPLASKLARKLFA